MENNTPPKPRFSYRLWKHPEVVAAIVGVFGIVIVAMIPLYCSPGKDDVKTESAVPCATTVYTDMRKFDIWNDSKDYYIWFNAQYALANTTQWDNHYVNLIRRMRFTFYLVRPTNGNAADSINFRKKFKDFRSFFRKAYNRGISDSEIIIREHLKEVYLVDEERRPAMSAFLTKDPDTNNEKVIMYIEDPELINEERIPQLCIISEDKILVELLKDRISKLSNRRALSYDDLVNESLPDDSLLSDSFHKHH